MNSINTNNKIALMSVKDNSISTTISMNQLPLVLENIILGYKSDLEVFEKNKINMKRIRDLKGMETTQRRLMVLKLQNIFTYPTKVYGPVF